MYGARARLGLIVPFGNMVMEPEFRKLLPSGVDLCQASIPMSSKTTAETLAQMSEGIDRAVDELVSLAPDVIGYGCTSGSLIKGIKWNQELIKRIEEKSHARAVTTSSAVINALRKMNVHKVAVGTPYTAEIDALERRFLKESGLEVVNLKGLGVLGISDMRYPPEAAYRLGKDVDRPEADGVFISCTNFRTIEIIARLESELKKPVVTSNQATLWNMLKLANVREPIRGYGGLLQEHL